MVMFAVAGVVAALAAAPQQGPVEPGSRPEYTFHEPLVNGQGVKSLADLRGRPVLVEFWGTR